MKKNSTNKFRLRTSNGRVIVNEVPNDNVNKVKLTTPKKISFEHNKVRIETTAFKIFEEFCNKICSDIMLMHTTEKNVDKIFCAFIELVKNYAELIKNMLPENVKKELESVFVSGTEFAIDKFKSRNTARKRNSLLESNEYYVKPENHAIGMAWQAKNKIGCEIPDHKLTQTVYQYVPIISTIQSLFNNDEFLKSYFEFNENKKHVCNDESYEDFCCASIFKENDVFTPTTLLIQLGIDEFEPCNALKSKSGLHKMCAIYFEIRNIDPKLKSKLNNIHLVGLVKSQDLKADSEAADKVARQIVNELSILESTGIIIKSGQPMRGVLINVLADNLGANGIFGFVESFSATFYCRICELISSECKITVEEVPEKLRKKSTHQEMIDYLNNTDRPDYKSSKGVKKSCVFDRLNHFHIFDNCSVDIMHDMNEGVIPFFIQHLFNKMISEKIATYSQLQALCRDHDYGHIWKKYKPSVINIERKNLNQNAMQSYCLILNLPFILLKFKSKMEPLWGAMECLLKSLQILYSTSIRKSEVDRLQLLLKEYLTFLVQNGVNLTPKHHLITHYPNLITKIGPLIHSWMMRFESKHKMFTDFVHLTYNFKNLPLTLAKRHQARACAERSVAFKIRFEPSKTSYELKKYADFIDYQPELLQMMNNDIEKIKGLQFLHHGSLEFRRGLFLIENGKIFEIAHVTFRDSKYFILCQKYKINKFDASLNSIEIAKIKQTQVLDVTDINSNKSYDKIVHDGKSYIIADTLEVFYEF